MSLSIRVNVSCDSRGCGNSCVVIVPITLNRSGKMKMDDVFALPEDWGSFPADTTHAYGTDDPRAFCPDHCSDWSRRR